MNISNKLIDILSLQAAKVALNSAKKNVQKVFDVGQNADQWNAYCLKTGEHFDLPEGMTEIPDYMFNGHSNLKTVSGMDSITEIYQCAFEGSGIQISQLPESLKSILGLAFALCNNINAIVFSPSIEYVAHQTFYGNANLAEATFVKTNDKTGTPSYLSEKTFEYCPNLITIRVPWSEGDVEGAPWGAENATIVYNFWDTARTSEVFTFPQGFIKIPDYLFYDTTKTTAKEIYIGDECKEIGEASFYKAQNLETVHLPEGLTKLGAYAFRYCSALNLSELPDNVEEIGNRAFHGSSISLSKLPTNIKELGINCFQNCSGNKFTEIPAGIVRISAAAFANNTGLTTLTFLSTPEVDKVVKGIASDAFAGCTNLVEICVPWSEGQVSGAPWGAENATIIYDWRNN